ncbi:MAG: TetR family transcriptional regulator [Candidatus Marinimicrobia bacterium]|nr:TetR family transcriptional regulator [Candidatus Neomarinimicrobiota bacterium]
MKTFTAKGQRARQRLLEVAIRLFAAQGFDGVSVDQIVAEAHINKRMVYHYFGSKEQLYQAALAAEYGKLESLELKTLHPDEPIAKVVADVVQAYFRFLRRNPEFVKLLLWENLNGGRNLKHMPVPLSKGPMMELLLAAVNAGKLRGTVRADVDPRFLLISLIGNCMVYFSNRHTLSAALDLPLGSNRVLAAAQRAVTTLLLQGIQP